LVYPDYVLTNCDSTVRGIGDSAITVSPSADDKYSYNGSNAARNNTVFWVDGTGNLTAMGRLYVGEAIQTTDLRVSGVAGIGSVADASIAALYLNSSVLDPLASQVFADAAYTGVLSAITASANDDVSYNYIGLNATKDTTVFSVDGTGNVFADQAVFARNAFIGVNTQTDTLTVFSDANIGTGIMGTQVVTNSYAYYNVVTRDVGNIPADTTFGVNFECVNKAESVTYGDAELVVVARAHITSLGVSAAFGGGFRINWDTTSVQNSIFPRTPFRGDIPDMVLDVNNIIITDVANRQFTINLYQNYSIIGVFLTAKITANCQLY
jgi:hypothetical protein